MVTITTINITGFAYQAHTAEAASLIEYAKEGSSLFLVGFIHVVVDHILPEAFLH
jgi:uncharacterized protein YbaP (TraB family)